MYNKDIADANQLTSRYIIKRSGKQVVYNQDKIRKAICKANQEELRKEEKLNDEDIEEIVRIITADVYHASHAFNVEEIQDKVEREICKRSYNVFLLFHDYRAKHAEARQKSELDAKIEGIINVTIHDDGSVTGGNEEVNQENSNKNPVSLNVQRDYIAGEWSRHYLNKYILPQDIQQAHDQGIIHVHDTDFISMQMHNCDLINLEDMLQNGTKMSGTPIHTPKSFMTAATLMTQISLACSAVQYGGQSMSLAHIAPFVDVSRQKIRKRIAEEFQNTGIQATQEQINTIAEQEVVKEVQSGCQTIQYQLITMSSGNGQAPFITLFMYLHEVPEGQTRDDLRLIIRTMLEQRIEGIDDGKGHKITVAFPKLIYVLQEDNISPETKDWDLTQLAAKCTAKRLVPDYISEKIELKLKGDVYPPMGCRSLLTPDRFTDAGLGNIANAGNYSPDKHKYYGRFNIGVCTISLPDIALSSGGDENKFWKIFDERLELCHRTLQVRIDTMKGTPSDVAPILWQDGALARLAPGETIDKLLYNGYATVSLGYAGLYECVKYMIGESHTEESGRKFGMKVMQHLNDACAKWKAEENIDYSVYGTPLESTTYKFAKCLQRRFGEIKGITDRNYITNSYHIPVFEKIDAFSKLTKEAPFQELSPGGAISYVEIPNMQQNLKAIEAMMRHIYETNVYAELNTKSDICFACGYEGEVEVVSVNGKLEWECPNCGNRDQHKMQVVRRTCGYIGTQYWNQGRTAEIKDRTLHVAI